MITHEGRPCTTSSQPAGAAASDARAGLMALQVHKELGLQLHPIEETYIDFATTLIQQGVAKPVPK